MCDYKSFELKDIPENPVVLDFSGCRSMLGFHKILQRDLGFPDGYGKNWEALWDLMWQFRDYPITIEIHGLQTLPSDLIQAANKMLEIFDEVHTECPQITFVQIS